MLLGEGDADDRDRPRYLLVDLQRTLTEIVGPQRQSAVEEPDGGEQFFSRAIDFGYSKTAEETLNNWDRELILGDIVRVIRQFRPDVITTRFNNANGGHGHHLSSAMTN